MIVLRTIYALFLALDLLLSALTFGAPLETISARLAAGKRHGSRVATVFCDGLDRFVAVFLGHANHCESALAAYQARVAAAPSWSG